MEKEMATHSSILAAEFHGERSLQAVVRRVAESDTTEVTGRAHTQWSALRGNAESLSCTPEAKRNLNKKGESSQRVNQTQASTKKGNAL